MALLRIYDNYSPRVEITRTLIFGQDQLPNKTKKKGNGAICSRIIITLISILDRLFGQCRLINLTIEFNTARTKDVSITNK